MTLPTGVRLALDWGKARIGVAACDRDGLLAYPVATVAATDPWRELERLVAEYEPAAIVVGLPRNLKGAEGPAAEGAIAFARALAAFVRPLEVWLVDERLSTVSASHRLRAAGKSAKAQRGIVDQAAAVAILEAVLDAERGGHSIGRLLPGDGAEEER